MTGALVAAMAAGPSSAAMVADQTPAPVADGYDANRWSTVTNSGWVDSSDWGVQGRHDLCHFGNYLFVLQPIQQAALKPLLAGSDADRAANIGPYRPRDDGPELGTASQQDSDAFKAWVAKTQNSWNAHRSVLTSVDYQPTDQDIDPAVGALGWLLIPDFSSDAWKYRFNSQSGYPDDGTPPQADQAALDRAKAIQTADPTIQFSPGTDAFDVADFITGKGPVTAANVPAPGTIEFRTDVENLKTRWGACDASNPFDVYDVLGPEVEAASAEWQAELASQASQRDDIVGAYLAAGADLNKASDAMIEAMWESWTGQRLAEAQRAEARWDQSDLSADQVADIARVKQDMADVKTHIQAQLDIANAAAADAHTQVAKINADQGAAAGIAKAEGAPYGRGLLYAQQAAQVAKASSAAVDAAVLTVQTAQAAVGASAADAAGEWAKLQAKSAALDAQFRKAAAAEAADQAHKAAADAADRAMQAQDKVADAHAARGVAEKAQADAAAQATLAKTKRAAAEDARSRADAAAATAQTQRAAAAKAQGDASTQQQATAAADKTSADAVATLKTKASAAADAETRAARARADSVTAQSLKDVTAARAKSADAAAAAAVGTAAAADAKKAADAADAAAASAATAADTAGKAADQASAAAVMARAAATTAAAEAAKAQAATADAHAAAAKSQAAAWDAHAAAADADATAVAAARDAVQAQTDADAAAVAAAQAKGSADAAKKDADTAVASAAIAAGQAEAAASSALAARDAASGANTAAAQSLALGAPYRQTDTTAGLAGVVADNSQTLSQAQSATAQAASDAAAKAAADAKALAGQASGDAKDSAKSASAAAADSASATASSVAARKSAADVATEAAAAKTADDAAAVSAAQALTDAQAADAASAAATASSNSANQAATDAEKDATLAHTNAVGAHNDADALKKAADQARAASDAAANSAATAVADAQKAADASDAALAQAIKDEKDRETAAANAASTDANNWTVSSPVGVQAREDWCDLAGNLHAGGTNVQNAIATAFAGTEADRRAVSNVGWYDHDNSNFTNAVQTDRAAFDTWATAHTDTAVAQPLRDMMDPFFFGMPSDYYNVPNYSDDQRMLRANEADSAVHFQALTAAGQPTQAEIDRAVAIGTASSDPADKSPVTSVGGVISRDQLGKRDISYDVASYLTHGGYIQTAPASGTMEFRTEVEDLKARWSGCVATNPWDPHHVLTGVEAQATAEWQTELDAVAPQRNDITTASIAASADLHKAADAMDQAMTLAWAGQRFLDWQRYWSARPADYQFYGLDPALKDKAAANLVDLQNRIKAQLDIANAASADAKAQADKVTTDEAAAGDIAKTNGTPYGRGLSYAQQSGQVTKASAAASQAAALATETALHATQAGVSDAAALWSLADTQAHALQAQFARTAAQDAADQAHKAALAAADQATQAAAQATRAHNDRSTAEKAQAVAASQGAIAAGKRKDAQAQQAVADQAKADATKQQGIAAQNEGEAETQKTNAANAHGVADQAAAQAKSKADAAVAAESQAATARDAAVNAANAKDAADAHAQAANATAAAAVGTKAAGLAQDQANKANAAATQAANAAAAAQTASDNAAQAAVTARADATRASSAAAKANSDAAGADAARDAAAAAALTAHAAAADAINAASQAAQNATNAQNDANNASSAAAKSQADADNARSEANQAAASAIKTAGFAQASAAAALAARDSASKTVDAGNKAVQFGAPYQETDAAAGLAVLIGQDSKTLSQQQDTAAQAASDEAAKAAAAAKALADQANGDAKAAATAAAQAAQDAVTAQQSANSARQSALAAATDSAATQSADAAATQAASQAAADAASAHTAADTASADASAASGSATAAEKDAAAAHTAANDAATEAAGAKDSAAAAQKSADTAAAAATTANSDAAAAQQAATDADAKARADADAAAKAAADQAAKNTATQDDTYTQSNATLHEAILEQLKARRLVLSWPGAQGMYLDDPQIIQMANDPETFCQANSGTPDCKAFNKAVNHAKWTLFGMVVATAGTVYGGVVLCEVPAVGGLCAAAADYMLTGTTDTLFAMMAAESAAIMAGPIAGEATGDILGGDAALAETDDQLAAKIEAKVAEEVQQQFAACGHSFAAGTDVLMADGSNKPIQDVRVDDLVANSAAGVADRQQHRVGLVHRTTADTDYTDLTINTSAGTQVITGTQNHPYYDYTAGGFVPAGKLRAGDRLQSADGSTATVQSVSDYTGSMVTYDLTIDGLHTYYVSHGGSPVLVHNTDTTSCMVVLGMGAQGDALAAQKNAMGEPAMTYNNRKPWGDPVDPNNLGSMPKWMDAVLKVTKDPNVPLAVELGGLRGLDSATAGPTRDYLKGLVDARRDLTADRKTALKAHIDGLSNFSLAYYNAYVRGVAVTKQYGTDFQGIANSGEGTNWEISVLGFNTRREEREWNEIHWYANGQEIGGLGGGDSPQFIPPPDWDSLMTIAGQK
ncbi:polymorphic toxin-type HINT domain-containing protein [Catenulispora pinisilvae]|uniref:polymorphic toxin-type HINT domain-containing protein n=1 Tax=Catenulispora pinisilvae TaxID=2705253 RepID=UPI0018920CD2|nr:polymorphic toxin-type HINT domain-containing protein [Catenulispora pinisilvae]